MTEALKQSHKNYCLKNAIDFLQKDMKEAEYKINTIDFNNIKSYSVCLTDMNPEDGFICLDFKSALFLKHLLNLTHNKTPSKMAAYLVCNDLNIKSEV